MALDLNTLIGDLFTDAHTTLAQARSTLQAVSAAAEAITTQANRLGAVLDGLQADEQGVLATVTDADSVMQTVKVPWLFKK